MPYFPKKVEKPIVPLEEEDVVGGKKMVVFVPVGITTRNAVCGGYLFISGFRKQKS